MRIVALSLVARVAGVYRVLGRLHVVVEVGRRVGSPRVGDRLVPDRHGVALLGGHNGTLRQRGRPGNGPA
jgi:hypothetical protein